VIDDESENMDFDEVMYASTNMSMNRTSLHDGIKEEADFTGKVHKSGW